MDGWMDGFVNFSGVDNQCKQYSTHLHTNICPINDAILGEKRI